MERRQVCSGFSTRLFWRGIGTSPCQGCHELVLGGKVPWSYGWAGWCVHSNVRKHLRRIPSIPPSIVRRGVACNQQKGLGPFVGRLSGAHIFRGLLLGGRKLWHRNVQVVRGTVRVFHVVAAKVLIRLCRLF